MTSEPTASRDADLSRMQGRRPRSEPQASEGPAGEFTSPVAGRIVPILEDGVRPRSERARAAVAMGELAALQGTPAFAEYFAIRAEELDPGRVDTSRLLLRVRAQERATEETIRRANELLEKAPDDLELLRIKATALLEDAQVAEALGIARRAYELALGNEAIRRADRVRAIDGYAFAAFKAQLPDLAAQLLFESLRFDPKGRQAHADIAEIVLPDLDDRALRAKIDPKLREANEAYARGDYARMKELAFEILELDAREGLAHKLVETASVLLEDAKNEQPLIPLLDTEAKQRALVEQLAAVAGRARMGDQVGGRPEDLFPGWEALDLLRRATIAASVLPFARFIPALMEQGALFCFVLPGDSLAAADPQIADIKRRKAFGRYSYSGRGWAWKTKLQVFAGAEKIDFAARGRRNTITHEFAHLVHYQLLAARDAAQSGARARVAPGGGPPVIALGNQPGVPGDRTRAQRVEHAAAADRVDAMYLEAKARQNGQKLLDAYSGNNALEYFAQAAMAYLSPTDELKESAPRLFARNPKMWREVQAMIREIAEFPAEVLAPDPPARGVGDDGTARGLFDLVREAKSALVARLAEGLWDSFAREAKAETPGPRAARKARARAILARAEELGAIDKGAMRPHHLGDLGLIDRLSPSELEAQILLAVRGLATHEEEREDLLALYRTLNHLGPEDARRRLHAAYARIQSLS